MATNKNALIRYKVLDNCFRNPGKKYFIDDLIAECESILLERDPKSNGISRRQIFDDISFMESEEGWSIELNKLRDGKKVYYTYVDSSFSINNMPLNEIEINQLKSAVDILTQFKGMPQFEWIHELVPKLQQGISPEQTSPTIIEFDNNHYLKGIEYLGTLHNAIFYKKVLSISYQPFENELPFDIIIHPYFLKQYNNRWFLFGYNPERQIYNWNLAIDRISSIVETKSKYHENTKINWSEYFDDIIGVTKPVEGLLENVILHFTGKTGKYMETKPIHGSQKSSWLENQTLEVRLEVIINYELERLILSYADSVVVIQPESLAQTVKERLKAAVTLY
ncbi:WYL domain-containing protein [uncultured Arcticibacterium sp.]|uniref:helix-turn-helix transcriptional regulator n=1 Tax=uncultured Arcticibacterium sp. TaxID=2173042 RepID=UPI0030FD110D